MQPWTYEKDRPHTFVCYAHADRDTVLREITALHNEGINLWFDEGIYGGSEWPEELANAIQTCSSFLFFVSPDSVGSRNCRDEIQYARECRKRVIVVYLKETALPPALELSLGTTHALKKQLLETRVFREKLISSLLNESAPAYPAKRSLFSPRTVERVVWVSALVAVLGIAAALYNRAPHVPLPRTSFSVSVPEELDITPARYIEMQVAPPLVISPDGRRVVFSARDESGTFRLYLRALDSFETRELPGTEDAIGPFFSPDSEWVGFLAERTLKKLRLAGGTPETIVPEVPGEGFGGASWGDGGLIVYNPSAVGGIFRVSAFGGVPQVVSEPDENQRELSYVSPHLLPGNEHLLVSVRSGLAPEAPSVEQVSLATGERTHLIDAAIGAKYGRGKIVYGGSGNLTGSVWVQDFLPGNRTLSGEPRRMVDGVASDLYSLPYFDVSSTGTLVYIPVASQLPPDQLMWVGGVEPPEVVAETEHDYITPALSPDGRYLMTTEVDAAREMTLWMHDLRRSSSVRIRRQSNHNHQPVWTPDGTRYVFTSNHEGPSNLYLQTVDASDPPVRLTNSEKHHDAASFSPDGRLLSFAEIDPETNWDIWVLDMATGEARAFLATPAEEMQPVISPDGGYLAYTSNETGERQIYLERFPDGGKKTAVSTDGGLDPLWSRDGAALFYRLENRIFRVAMIDLDAMEMGEPQIVYQGEFEGRAAYGKANWEINLTGDRYLVSVRRSFALEPRINLVTGWLR